MTNVPNDDNSDDTTEAVSCPHCDEDRIDKLVWDEDGERITCLTCGCNYDPFETEGQL
jgi:hypothetical protein